jgi:hypothetical protein
MEIALDQKANMAAISTEDISKLFVMCAECAGALSEWKNLQ